MKHYIITRFNVKVYGWEKAKDGSPVLDEEWLKHRFKLFSKYCYPSVCAQTNQNFEWCVFFDVNTSAQFRNRINFFSKKNGRIIPFYVADMDCVNSEMIKHINDTAELGQYVITTRLDNDDILNSNFVNRIQEMAREKDGLVVDLTTGYQLNIKSAKSEIRAYSGKFNPFVSVVEKVPNIQTVLSKRHVEWKDAQSIIAYSDAPMWIELVHDKNKLNDTSLRSPILKSADLRDFGLGEYKLEKSCLYIKLANFKAVNWRLYFILKQLVKKVLFKYTT
ncbi:glycosyltransferase [Saccharicrinis sp. GN24d3]|uniref:glycosyltransferase n=1 Tax=Saccharicrinis sp. GN24d3 TaxID=3458416 RepID=UPI0040361E5B